MRRIQMVRDLRFSAVIHFHVVIRSRIIKDRRYINICSSCAHSVQCRMTIVYGQATNVNSIISSGVQNSMRAVFLMLESYSKSAVDI